MSKENYTKWENISYTLKHKIAFLKTEKRLTGSISLAGILHDIDKIWLYIRYDDDKYIQKRHRENSSHHVEYKKGKIDYLQMIIDCECARLTKPDKPLDAYETFVLYYPEHLKEPIVYYYFKKLGLLKEEK